MLNILMVIEIIIICNDNDYSVASEPFPGLVPIPRDWTNIMERLFWWLFGTGFCENIDSDRTYEFSVVETYGQQFEVSLISDFDGPFNYTVGAYTFRFKKS